MNTYGLIVAPIISTHYNDTIILSQTYDTVRIGHE